jgi:hypothetical protein
VLFRCFFPTTYQPATSETMFQTKPTHSILFVTYFVSSIVISSHLITDHFVDAFASSSPNTANLWMTTTSASITRLASSSLDDDDIDIDDNNEKEGSLIKQETKEEDIQGEDDIHQQTLLGDAAKSFSPGGGDDDDDDALVMDWDKLPTFQTERPIQQSKTMDDQQQQQQVKETSSSFRSDSTWEPTNVDFLADYEDENGIHIPNGLGFVAQSGGDESEGVVAKGKLKKGVPPKRRRFTAPSDGTYIDDKQTRFHHHGSTGIGQTSVEQSLWDASMIKEINRYSSEHSVFESESPDGAFGTCSYRPAPLSKTQLGKAAKEFVRRCQEYEKEDLESEVLPYVLVSQNCRDTRRPVLSSFGMH